MLSANKQPPERIYGWLDQCHFGDCLETLRRMPDGIVQTCVTSPPYFGLRDYGHDGQIGLESTPEQYIAKLVDVFREVRRVLRDDGTLWLNIGDSYNAHPGQRKDTDKAGDKQQTVRGATAAPSRSVEGIKSKDLIGIPWLLAFALRADGYYLRQEIIWHKPNPMPESVTDRCTKSHESIFLLAKSAKYYFDAGAIREDSSSGANGSNFHTGKTFERQQGLASKKPHRAGNVNPPKGSIAYANGDERQRTKAGLLAYAQRTRQMDDAEIEKRNKRSVWTVATAPYKGAHFATFPPALIEPCILAGAPAGGVVLDPFFGSGTTGQVAQALGRHYIGCEINPDYKPLQDERTMQPSLLMDAA